MGLASAWRLGPSRAGFFGKVSLKTRFLVESAPSVRWRAAALPAASLSAGHPIGTLCSPLTCTQIPRCSIGCDAHACVADQLQRSCGNAVSAIQRVQTAGSPSRAKGLVDTGCQRVPRYCSARRSVSHCYFSAVSACFAATLVHWQMLKLEWIVSML